MAAHKHMSPKAFREEMGLNLTEMARMFGIEGDNPGRTWGRWEEGERRAPTSVVIEIERLSKGRVRLQDWPTPERERLTAKV